MFISQLFIYSCEGHYLSTIRINGNPFDATWTPRGNIVYTTCNSIQIGSVVVMSKTGTVIEAHYPSKKPLYLSVSKDFIYLTDMYLGVYRSTNDGVWWSLVLVSHVNWFCNQVIQVTTGIDNIDDLWTLEFNRDKYRLGVYRISTRRPHDNVTWKEINVTKTDGSRIQLHSSRLSHNGNNNVFLLEFFKKEVHFFSVTGRYRGQLSLSHQINNRSERLAVDREHQILYIGQELGVVGVFQLPYSDKRN